MKPLELGHRFVAKVAANAQVLEPIKGAPVHMTVPMPTGL